MLGVVMRLTLDLPLDWKVKPDGRRARNTSNDAVLAEGRRALIDVVDRFDGVRVIGVDEEHVWRHTRTGDKT